MRRGRGVACEGRSGQRKRKHLSHGQQSRSWMFTLAGKEVGDRSRSVSPGKIELRPKTLGFGAERGGGVFFFEELSSPLRGLRAVSGEGNL